ncbi:MULTISPECIES: hypothetical protein [Oscillospiraceae]|uniref:hypothetical protein n=1 Tax=Oscillospiraceae TaxID=216572 RepID=UPI001FAA4A2C|nr:MULTISPECIES: hypothetical protein [Oscillospiraceae]
MEQNKVEILEALNNEKMYSLRGDEVGKMCSPEGNDTCGDGSVATKTSYVEILNFRHFFKHIVFTSEKDKIRNKEIKNYVNVSVVIDIECGNAKLEAL